VFLLLCSWSCQAATLQVEANPIRKVVTILQDMQKELAAEGDKEEGLFNTFMCYCDGNTDGMSKSAADAGQAITELTSKLEAEKAEKSQLDQELIQHKMDRAGAKKDLETAESIRAKEHSDFTDTTGDQKENLDAMNGAIAALEKGAGASFLQGGVVAKLSKAVEAATTVDDFQKTQITEFLQGKNPNGDYGSQSGEIVGMLKAMKDEMDKDLGGAISTEEEAQKGSEELAAAKNAEIQAASEAVESKTARAGELAVAITTTADDIEDTTAEMTDTNAFLANLASQCATKKQEWAGRQKSRAEEIAAISMAIKILNDDDALDLFKNTLSLEQSSSSMGFLQKKSSTAATLRARDLVVSASKASGVQHRDQLALLEFSLKAKSVDFSKVIAQIDNMSAIMVSEQKDDDQQKDFCDTDLAKSEKQKADTETAIASSTAAIEEAEAASVQTADEIAALTKEIAALDKAVADATAQRKEEHAEFLQYSTESSAAVQLIEKAKNALFKFYRPNLHKAAPKRELTDEEQLVLSSGGVDPRVAEEAAAAAAVFVQVQIRDDAAPPPPPATWDAYQKKDGKSNGVIALMEMLTKELTGDMTAAKNDEETSQRDYERLMADSTSTRAQNVESITAKEASKADLDVTIQNTKQQKTSQTTELANVGGYIAQLHANCDFLIDNYDLRKAARQNEAESLKNAKSVLSGANFA